MIDYDNAVAALRFDIVKLARLERGTPRNKQLTAQSRDEGRA